MEMKSIDKDQLIALKNVQLNKLKITWAYNKHVKKKEFEEKDLLWKIILPIKTKDPKLDKQSLNWERLFVVSQTIPKEAYWLINMQG